MSPSTPTLPELLPLLHLHPDPSQLGILSADPHRCVINCTRQWGKSTVTALKAVHKSLSQPNSLTLVLSPSARQSGEFLRKAAKFLHQLGIHTKSERHLDLSLVLPNKSRIVGLPAKEETTRGFSSADLLIVDEASRVSDSLYQAVRPSLAASDGQLWIISTPAGRRGFFYDACIAPPEDQWHKIEIPATSCTRIGAKFLAEEQRTKSDHIFRQEYLCEFLDSEDAVFPSHTLDKLSVSHPPLIPFDPALWSNCLFTETDHTIFEGYAYYYVGVDLGQSQDFTAICVLEAAKVITGARNGWDFAYPTAMRYTIRHIERMPLGTPYDKIVNRVRFMLRHPALGQYPKLVVDATGVGRAVVDLFKRADTGARIIPLTLTGGEKPTRDGDSYNVPRSHLLASLEVAIQTGQIGICKDLPAAPLFLNELRSLRRTTNDTGAARVEPSSTRTHDDLVFAAALAYWKATSKL